MWHAARRMRKWCSQIKLILLSHKTLSLSIPMEWRRANDCQIDKSSLGESSWHNRQYYPSNLSLNGCIKYAFHSSSLVHSITGVAGKQDGFGSVTFLFSCNNKSRTSCYMQKYRGTFSSLPTPKAKLVFPRCRRRLCIPLAVSLEREKEINAISDGLFK